MKKTALLVLALSLAGRAASHRAGSYPAAAVVPEPEHQPHPLPPAEHRPAPNDGDWREIKRMFRER